MQRRAKALGIEGDIVKEWDVEIVDVRPGVYKFTQDYSFRESTHENHTYATFQWDREPDGRDTFTAFNEEKLVAGQYLLQSVRNYPTLYVEGRDVCPWEDMTEDQRKYALYRVVDHLFFVIGNGVDWHHNGHPAATLDPDLEDLNVLPDEDLPDFTTLGPLSWYPLGTYARVLKPGGLNDSFAKLVFMAFKSITTHGVKTRDKRFADQDKETERKAAELLVKFSEAYPHLVKEG
jgi:hypothetical protein